MLEGTKVLWPEGDSYYSLMEYKITHGTRAFQSEKQSSPIDPSTTLFDNSKIVYYNRQQLIMEDLTIFGALDASSGQARKHGDLACVTTIGKHRKTGIIYVLDSWAKEAPPTDCISYMKQMHKMYRYTRFAVDSDSLKLLKSNIEHEIPDLRLTMYNLRIQKNKRFEKLEPLISNGTIQLLKAQLELLTEIDTYPKSEYDDALDSLEMAVTMSSNRSYQLRTY
jgi:predicted phage terminase large subunit-like protein